MPDDNTGAGDLGGGVPALGGDDAGIGAAEGEALDLEQIVADADAAVEAAFSKTATTEGGKTEDGKGEGKAAPAADLSKIRAFLKKNYGSEDDEDAFLQSVYANRAEQKRLADEVAELKRAPAPPRDIEKELEALRAQDPDVQTVNRQFQAIEASINRTKTEQSRILQRGEVLRQSIDTNRAKLSRARPEDDTSEWNDAIINARVELAELGARFSSNVELLETKDMQREMVQREYARIDQAIRDSIANEERQAKQQAVEDERTRHNFGLSFDHAMKAYGLNPESPRYSFAREAVRSMLADYLESLGDVDGLDAAGMYEATSKLTAAYAKAHDMQPASAEQPRPRTQPRQTLTPRPTAKPGAQRLPSSPRANEDLQNDPEYWRKRARAIDSAAARSSGRRILS